MVRFSDIDGFSGPVGRDIVGEAQASIEDGTLQISATASGALADEPTDDTS